MNLESEQESTNKSEVDEGVNNNRNTTCLKCSKLNHSVPSESAGLELATRIEQQKRVPNQTSLSI